MLKVEKCCYKLTSLVSLSSLWQGNVKKSKNWWILMEIANTGREILHISLHIFLTTWGVSMKFSGRIWLLILNVTKKQFHPLFRRYIFRQKKDTHSPPPPRPSPAILGSSYSFKTSMSTLEAKFSVTALD